MDTRRSSLSTHNLQEISKSDENLAMVCVVLSSSPVTFRYALICKRLRLPTRIYSTVNLTLLKKCSKLRNTTIYLISRHVPLNGMVL